MPWFLAIGPAAAAAISEAVKNMDQPLLGTDVAEFVRAKDQPPEVEWHTVDGLFIKQMFIAKAGTFIPQHSHEYDHTSMLAVGSVWLWRDGALDRQYRAPCPIVIKAGVKHMFQALEDGTTIYCIHNLHGADAVSVLAEHHLVGEV